MPLSILSAIIMILSTVSFQQSQEKIQDVYYMRSINQATGVDQSVVYTISYHDGETGITWGCGEGKLMVVFMGSRLLDKDNVRIECTFDDTLTISNMKWTRFGDRTTANLSDSDVAEFTAKAKAGLVLRIDVWDWLGSRQLHRMSLKGLTAALRRLPCTNLHDSFGDVIRPN